MFLIILKLKCVTFNTEASLNNGFVITANVLLLLKYR